MANKKNKNKDNNTDFINSFRPVLTEFICTQCKSHENIPTDIVLNMDMMDPGDISYPPMFNCEKCNGLMRPKYYLGYTGIVYTYDAN